MKNDSPTAHIGLFDNSSQANVTSTVAMVEDVLLELGHFLNECRDKPTPEGQRSWRITKGSAVVRIRVLEPTRTADPATSHNETADPAKPPPIPSIALGDGDVPDDAEALLLDTSELVPVDGDADSAANDDVPHLRVVSVLMTMDQRVDEAGLFRHLLELNASEIYGAAFGIDGDEVQLVAERSTLDLDRGEVLDLLRRIERYADDYDDKLVAAFGGIRGARL
jgi:hypothetical protein